MPKTSASASPTSHGPGPDAEARVLRRFRQIYAAVRTHFQWVEKRAGVGGAQFWALGVIGAQPGVGVSELARAMQVHQSTASNLVRALTERGFVLASRDGPDRRMVQLHLSAAGHDVLARAPGPHAGVLPQALSELDAQTLARLEHDLGQLIKVLGVNDEAPSVPLAQL